MTIGLRGATAVRVAQAIRDRLTTALAPSRLELADESARHAGHAGARPEGESHFRLTIAASAFTGKSRIERQRMVFTALGDLMQSDIHALSITALTPAEDAARTAPAYDPRPPPR
jgi:BolA family transcriptional regulator, general stress-responsive regulator